MPVSAKMLSFWSLVIPESKPRSSNPGRNHCALLYPCSCFIIVKWCNGALWCWKWCNDVLCIFKLSLNKTSPVTGTESLFMCKTDNSCRKISVRHAAAIQITGKNAPLESSVKPLKLFGARHEPFFFPSCRHWSLPNSSSSCQRKRVCYTQLCWGARCSGTCSFPKPPHSSMMLINKAIFIPITESWCQSSSAQGPWVSSWLRAA